MNGRVNGASATTMFVNDHICLLLPIPRAAGKQELLAHYDVDAAAYLERAVFPTLLPALEKLLKAVKRHDGSVDMEQGGAMAAESDNVVDPINWLAQVGLAIWHFGGNRRRSLNNVFVCLHWLLTVLVPHEAGL